MLQMLIKDVQDFIANTSLIIKSFFLTTIGEILSKYA
jgi:hypothetical protein